MEECLNAIQSMPRCCSNSVGFTTNKVVASKARSGLSNTLRNPLELVSRPKPVVRGSFVNML